METMISSLWTALFTIINVLVLFLLLKKFLFGPVNKIMEKRQAIIKENLENAESSKKEADELKAHYESTISTAKDEARTIISNASEQAKKQNQKSKEETLAEIEKMKSQAYKDIESEKKKALQSTHDQIAELALEAASKIMQRNIKDEDNKKIVNDFLAEEASEK